MPTPSFSPWPSYTDEEMNAVRAVLSSGQVNYWTGSECRDFEHEYAEWVGARYAIALANGSIALELALKALGIGSGDEVVVTPRSFIASVSCVVNIGATPVFADVEATSGNLSIRTIEPMITTHTKAIICVHLAGWPCDMDPIMKFARDRNLFVIEDCAQAHGARYKGRSVGSIGDIACWSFCQDKIISTGGEGGMVTTSNHDLWSRMWSFKDHGKSWEAVHEHDHPPGFRWLHNSFGTNWRMTEMQASIGRVQLTRLLKWSQQRYANAEAIWNTAKGLPDITVPESSCSNCSENCSDQDGCIHAAYKCYIFVKGSEALRDRIMADINDRGVPCFSGACPEIYLERAFDCTDFRPRKRLPTAKKLGETSLVFLCHPTLTKEEIQKTCDVLCEVVLAHVML